MTKLCDFKRDNLTVLMWLKYLLIGRRQEDVTNCATKFFYNKALLLYFQCHNFFTYFFFYIFMYFYYVKTGGLLRLKSHNFVIFQDN